MKVAKRATVQLLIGKKYTGETLAYTNICKEAIKWCYFEVKSRHIGFKIFALIKSNQCQWFMTSLKAGLFVSAGSRLNVKLQISTVVIFVYEENTFSTTLQVGGFVFILSSSTSYHLSVLYPLYHCFKSALAASPTQMISSTLSIQFIYRAKSQLLSQDTVHTLTQIIKILISQ